MIEIILIVGSFGVLAYFQSQQSSLGNSINIAGKNRFLTATMLLQTEKYLYGLSTDNSQLKIAMSNLESNIVTLKRGGMISDVDLKPLPSIFFNLWNNVDAGWNVFKTYVTNKLLTSPQARTTIDQSVTRKGVESMATDLVTASDKLVMLLGQQTDKNSQNLILLQILFAILIIGILVLILYLFARMLSPIFALTQATYKVKKGELDVSVKQKGSDELSVLGESFNSMVGSIRDYIKMHNELTKQLEAANEELKYKDRLKDEFIGVAAHELRNPIQPILGLSENIRYGRRRRGNSKLSTQDEKDLDIIIRNARRLLRLEQNILDVSRIESQTLKLNKERFNINQNIIDVINDIKSKENDDYKIEIVAVADPEAADPIIVEADEIRIYEVISNLLTNAIKFTKKSDISNNNDGDDSTILVSAKVSFNERNKEGNDNNEVVISIKDRGTGIDIDIKDKLFTKFATKSYTGLGLGLFISKSIVEAHGGKIWAHNNTDGKGATFAFSLPIIQVGK
jgi:signal transduction histidine kinase